MDCGYEGDEVRLDGWCEGGLGQQRNDGGGCASMHERSERVGSHGIYVTIFCLAVFFRTALPCSGGNHLERGGMHYTIQLG